jgi:hypothetical protein
MRIVDKAAQLNPDGMDADSIAAVHCPSWYGLPNITGCPRIEYVGRQKKPIQVKALNLCRECWNREYKPEWSDA